MGAVENAETQSKTVQKDLSERIEEKLDNGWRISSLPGGQLLLIPPPHLRDTA